MTSNEKGEIPLELMIDSLMYSMVGYVGLEKAKKIIDYAREVHGRQNGDENNENKDD